MISDQRSARAASAVTASPAAKRILIADDEPGIRSFIGRALTGAGYLPDFAASGTQALAQALECHYDLIILDLVMPDMEGTCVLDRILSARPEQAVIVVSCVANTATKVDCLERGAQDYLTKPFSLAELLARVRLRLREDIASRNQPVNSAEVARTGEVIRAGGLELDVAHLAADAGHGPVPLTRLEFMLLRELAEHVGQPVPKGSLLASVWGCDFDPRSNMVDVCIRRLRSKLGFDRIVTVRGAGYQLAGRLPVAPGEQRGDRDRGEQQRQVRDRQVEQPHRHRARPCLADLPDSLAGQRGR
jgi:DNA-binding response OmpR family regulator